MRAHYLLVGLLAASSLVACDESFTSPGNNVTVSGLAFNPATITLSGTSKTVTWGFLDGPHNVTFQDGSMGSGDRSTGAFSRDFTTVAAGTYRYRCTFHSTDFTAAGQMIGSVVVP